MKKLVVIILVMLFFVFFVVVVEVYVGGKVGKFWLDDVCLVG